MKETDKTATVMINAEAVRLLVEMAEAEGATPRQYMEALLHYAGSVHHRPGSWEAQQFCYEHYDDRSDEGAYADRWF